MVSGIRHFAMIGGTDLMTGHATRNVQIYKLEDSSRRVNIKAELLQDARVDPAAVFNGHDQLFVYGGISDEGNFVNTCEVIQVREKYETSRLMHLNLNFNLPKNPGSSRYELFMRKNNEGLCVVHVSNKAPDHTANDLSDEFWDRRSTNDISFEAIFTNWQQVSKQLVVEEAVR